MKSNLTIQRIADTLNENVDESINGMKVNDVITKIKDAMSDLKTNRIEVICNQKSYEIKDVTTWEGDDSHFKTITIELIEK